MAKKPDPSRIQGRSRQIIGFSLPPALAAEVKMEAARRNSPLRTLFSELWALYKKQKTV